MKNVRIFGTLSNLFWPPFNNYSPPTVAITAGSQQITSDIASSAIEVASVKNRKGLARAGSWFMKSTFPPLIL